jgi:hypothetical protein
MVWAIVKVGADPGFGMGWTDETEESDPPPQPMKAMAPSMMSNGNADVFPDMAGLLS